MGKAANLKRARLLKDAKRKREQEALFAAGHHPASLGLVKKTEALGAKVIPNETATRYSKLLQEFAKTLLADDDPIEVVRSKFNFAVLAWNASITKETNEAEFLATKKEVLAKMPDAAFFEALFEELVHRKQEEFAEHKKMIANFEIKKARGQGYLLTVGILL